MEDIIGLEEERRAARRLSRELLGIDERTWKRIIRSSMRAQDEAEHIHCVHEPESNRFVLWNGYGQIVNVPDDEAHKVYEAIAQTLELPHVRPCPNCQSILQLDGYCRTCDAWLENRGQGGS